MPARLFQTLGRHVLKEFDKLKTFSKFNVSSIKSNFKQEFELFNFDNQNKIRQLISSIKIRYDDEWKKGSKTG